MGLIALLAFVFIEDIRDYFQIRWTAFWMEREARIALKESTPKEYLGIVSKSVWIDIGGQRELTRTNARQSTFDRWIWIDPPCKNCVFDLPGAVILDRGHGEYHGTAQPRFESQSIGAAILINRIGVSAVCRRENKIFGGGCRSIVAVAIGFIEAPILSIE